MHHSFPVFERAFASWKFNFCRSEFSANLFVLFQTFRFGERIEASFAKKSFCLPFSGSKPGKILDQSKVILKIFCQKNQVNVKRFFFLGNSQGTGISFPFININRNIISFLKEFDFIQRHGEFAICPIEFFRLFP